MLGLEAVRYRRLSRLHGEFGRTGQPLGVRQNIADVDVSVVEKSGQSRIFATL